ncbi:MAG: hypothetical protein JXA42_19605 [Anaerolineales bacterium]|nr:hypothetical protein [Anaerolineales bacterium]
MNTPIDGFWLPKNIRSKILTSDIEYVTATFANGQPSEPGLENAVTVRWPNLPLNDWKELIAALEANRRSAPADPVFWERFCAALIEAGMRFSQPSDPLRIKLLTSLTAYTGFSEPMIAATLDMLEMISLDQLPAALSLNLQNRVAHNWLSMPGIDGRIRFFPTSKFRASQLFPGYKDQPLFDAAIPPGTVIGYGAGNVPGTALLIILLAQAINLSGCSTPLVIVKNSRREPILTPILLQAIEEVDPNLVANLAILIWDYQDAAIQEYLLQEADLVIAAAGDETIDAIQTQIDRSSNVSDQKPPARFHAHGHKISFSAIGREFLAQNGIDETINQPILQVAAFLAALDSIFWDQYGCLSSRIHFIETGGPAYHDPLEYASSLARHLELFSRFLPRGAWPRRVLYDSFDYFKYLEQAVQVKVLSNYDDEFLVVLDNRTYTPKTLHNVINKCQGRVIIVRPISDLDQIPRQYLAMIPAENLQSLSVAVGRPGKAVDERFLEFAQECGERGITAIRTLGRAAFPQIAFSWDGYIPLDLIRTRPPGHFTTIEFDNPYQQIIDTYRMFQRRTAV